MLSTLTQLGLTATARDRVKQVKPADDEEKIIPGSMADLIRQGAFGEKVVTIDAASLAAQDAQEEEEKKCQ